MKVPRLLSALAGLLIATPLLAQDLPLAEAEVRRVDARNGKITLRHGDIRNLDMPPMTMVFQVSHPTLLDQVKAGDRVRFTADRINGTYTVLSLQPAEGPGQTPGGAGADHNSHKH